MDMSKARKGNEWTGLQNQVAPKRDNVNVSVTSSLRLLGLVLGELLQDDHRLANLGVQRVGVVQQVEEFAVIHLQEHTSDFTRKLGLGTGGEK